MASKRAIRRRACLGKAKHADADAARHELRRLRQRRPDDRAAINIYRCAFCKTYHIGHAPARLERWLTTRR